MNCVREWPRCDEPDEPIDADLQRDADDDARKDLESPIRGAGFEDFRRGDEGPMR